MRRIPITLNQIADMANLETARHEAMRGANKTTREYQVWASDTPPLRALADDILGMDCEPEPTRTFKRWDASSRKWRVIDAPTMRDKIIQHAIIQCMQSWLSGFFIQHTMASIPGRGIEYARKTLRHWAHTGGKDVKYAVKWDIHHYYDNVCISDIFAFFNKRIEDKRVVVLIHRFLYNRVTGLYLGSFLSQWIANLYLTEFDHWMKEVVRNGHYLRYMDDGVAFFPSKKKAVAFMAEVQTRMRDYRLEVKVIGPGSIRCWKWADAPLDMIGYKTYRDGKQVLRERLYLSIRRQMDGIAVKGFASQSQARSLLSRYGFVKHSDCNRLHQEMDGFIGTYKLKEVAK